MGERTKSLRISLKREILRDGYSLAYCNAIQQVLSRHKRPARFRHVKNPNRRTTPFWIEMGECTQSVRMSSKREILQGGYSLAYYNAIRQVLSGQKRPGQFWHAENPNRRIAPIWHEMGECTQSLRMSSKCEILRGGYCLAYYNAIGQV
jgi:hypothetical protein